MCYEFSGWFTKTRATDAARKPEPQPEQVTQKPQPTPEPVSVEERVKERATAPA